MSDKFRCIYRAEQNLAVNGWQISTHGLLGGQKNRFPRTLTVILVTEKNRGYPDAKKIIDLRERKEDVRVMCDVAQLYVPDPNRPKNLRGTGLAVNQ